MAEAEIVADDDETRAQSLQNGHECGARHHAQALVEHEHMHAREAAAREQPPALAQTREARRWVLALQHLARHRLEGEQSGRQAQGGRARAGVGNQYAVPHMQAVVGADGQHAGRGLPGGQAAGQSQRGRAAVRGGFAAAHGAPRDYTGRALTTRGGVRKLRGPAGYPVVTDQAERKRGEYEIGGKSGASG